MHIRELKPKKALNKAFLKAKPNRVDIERFKTSLIHLLDCTNEAESEEFHKNLISDFLKNTYYAPNHFINTKGRNDLVIHNGTKAETTVGVIIEAKSPVNKAEMVTNEKLNTKAFQELVLYYLRERITHKNTEVKHVVITNINEWFLFDVSVFEKNFAQNKSFVQQFIDFEGGRLADTRTDFFYKQIAEPFIEKIHGDIEFTYFDLRQYQKPLRNTNKKDDNQLIALFKLLSPEHLLKLPFSNDSNSLDKRFYSELLHIIGLTETKEGSKKLIGRNKEGERHTGSILENALIQLDSNDKMHRIERPGRFGDTAQERLFNVALELSITWINRILFLKLLEAQLISYHRGDKLYAFLSFDRIKNYDDLNSLFFQVLARKFEVRNEEVQQQFAKIPYLNSSLFEPTEIEQITLFISNLRDDRVIPILGNTVLKNEQGKKRTGNLNALQYLFEFLNAYDFSSEGSEDIQEENKTLINASVLGLIFEKINGYKDGSFFTPGFITMYMCHETIRRAVVQKFNETKKWNCQSIEEVYDKIENRQEANDIVNSVKICDPAVGSGHFLVSALNEMIAIKNDLKILQDRAGKRLKEYHVEVVNDELIVTDEDGDLFDYTPGFTATGITLSESQRVQETLFHEKQTLIENCLFGVDINANSVKICRLRLWIELLKNAYYKNLTELETLPNIDINIKCGNSLVSRFAIDSDLKQALKKSRWTIDSYRIAVATYRNAESKEQKREMERLINDIKTDFRSEISLNDPKIKKLRKLSGELLLLTTQTSLFEQSVKEKVAWNKQVEKLTAESKIIESEIDEIKNNKIFENAFEWRFEFPEVLDEEGNFVGFDVVIGNPPWGANLSSDELHFVKNWCNDIVVRMVDSFMFFINLSFLIKSKRGLICQIIPDVILYQIDNLKLRQKILKDHQILKVVNLGDNIFEDVARPSCIIELGDKTFKPITEVFEFRIKEGLNIDKLIPTSVDTSLFEMLPNTVFATRNLKGYNLLSRFNKSILSELIDSDGIQRGISPDLKDAFVINNEILLNYSLEDKYVYPTITGGRDVIKYLAEDIGKKIIYTKKSDQETDIPNIIQYISNFKSRITCSEVRQGKHPFWALHRARERSIFEKEEKIVGVITGDKISVSIDTNKLFPTDGMYLFSSNGIYSNCFLVGLLNSNLISYLYRLISMEENRTLAQVKSSLLNNLPVYKNFNAELVSQIELKTKEIIAKIKSNDSFKQTENEIDQLVYRLYELTEEEIRIVEGGGK